MVVGQFSSEVTLLMVWGVVLLAAGRSIRARVSPSSVTTDTQTSSRLQSPRTGFGARTA